MATTTTPTPVTTAKVQLIIPTSINVITAVNEILITLKKNGEDPEVVLPSLRRRALLIVKESGVLPIQTVILADDGYSR